MQPIGIFDSGYGGLTIFKSITELLPNYDFVYLGDNARAPYGNRSYETVYEYTKECVDWLFKQNCPLVILACNTASAKALRTIQQNDLDIRKTQRVLGVIRPTAEIIGQYTKSNHIGILGTQGTISSQSYVYEIHNFYPDVKVFQHACPLWVPFIENGDYKNNGVDFFIEKDVHALFEQSEKIDTLILACTHYPLLLSKIKKFTPKNVTILSQGTLVANSLQRYLIKHQQMDEIISKNSTQLFYTTDSNIDFNEHASLFLGKNIFSTHISTK